MYVQHTIPIEPDKNNYVMKNEFYLLTIGFHQMFAFLVNDDRYKKMLKESDRKYINIYLLQQSSTDGYKPFCCSLVRTVTVQLDLY